MTEPTLATPAIWIPPAAARLAQARGNTVEVYPGGEVRMLADGPGKGSQGGAGHDGVYIQSGEVEDEHNPNLAPEFWRGCDNERGVYDKMIAEDPTAQAIRFARVLPLAATQYRIEPYTDRDGTVQPWAQEQADFVKTALFRLMHPGWTETKAQIAEFAGRGARYFEPIFRRDKELGRVVLDCLALRPLRSVENWVETPDGWSMEQSVLRGDGARGYMGGSSGPVIPAADLIGFRFFPQGSSPEPQGLFRPMYGPWKRRSTLARYEIQGANRYAYPIPVITIDPSNPNFTPGDRTKANNIAREFRAGIRSFVAMPPGYSLEFKTVQVDLAALRNSYNADGREMARAGLANHLFTGEDNGTQALFTGQFGGMFKQSLQYDANTVAAVLSEGPRALIRRLIVVNFGSQPGYPRMVSGEVPVGDPLAVVQAVAGMVEKRVLDDSDRAIDDHIREALSLPERPEPAMLPPAPKPDDEPPTTPEPTKAKADETREGDDADIDDAPTATAEALAERATPDRPATGPRDRAVRAAETVVRLSETTGVVTQGKAALAGVIVDWQERIAPVYAALVAEAPTLEAVAKVPVPGQAELQKEIAATLRDVYAAGSKSAVAELRRLERDPDLARRIEEQELERGEGGDIDAPLTFSDHPAGCDCGRGARGLLPRTPLAHRTRQGATLWCAEVVALADTVTAPKPAPSLPPSDFDEIDPEASIRGIAATTVRSAVARFVQAITAAFQARSLGGSIEHVPPAELGALARGTLAGLSPGPVLNQAQGDVNTIFGLGRQQEQRAQGVERYMYSNLLESQSCENCAAFDGTIFEADELDVFASPAVWCLGGDRCNCLTIGLPNG